MISMNRNIQVMAQHASLFSVAFTQMLPCGKFGDSVTFVFLKLSFTTGKPFDPGQEHKYEHTHADAHEGYHITNPLLIQKEYQKLTFSSFF